MSEITTKEQWLEERLHGIGASEASAILGMNPYCSNQELWEYKVGLREQKDIGDNPYVRYGLEAEAPLRALFALDFPRYEVIYPGPYDLIRNEEHPYIFATLDGRLIEKDTGRKGLLEIKTTEILKSMQKEKWKDGVPQNYYCQLIWQLLSTGFDFAVLKAQLKYQYGNDVEDVRTETKHYHIERADVLEDIAYLDEKAIFFWEKNVIPKKKPNLILPNI